MRFFHTGFAFLVVAACGNDYQTSPDAEPAPRATWYQDVAPIVSKHCMSCHQPGGIAPFSLMTYEDAQPNAQRMADKIDAGQMPPFDAREEADCTPRFGWVDDPRLSDAEKTTIHNWIADGTKAGEVAAIPPPPTTGLQGVTKTLVPTTPFTAAGTRDQFECFILDPGVTQQVAWLTGLQVRPGNNAVVHHAVLSELQAGTAQDQLLALHPVGTPFNCEAGTPAQFVMAIWTPGNQPIETPSELAVPVTAGAKIIMQIHYHPAGVSNAPDTTSVDLRFSQVWPKKMYFVTALGNAAAAPQLLPDPDDATTTPEFTIPANKADHVENMRFVMPDTSQLGDVRLYSVNPHMHLVGTHINGRITRANPGTEPQKECLANGGWNFDWQRTYTYNTTLDQLPSVKTGDTIDINCHWDNTMSNPFVQRLLHDSGLVAPIDIHLGEMTTNEMCLEIFGLAINAPAQPTGRVSEPFQLPALNIPAVVR